MKKGLTYASYGIAALGGALLCVPSGLYAQVRMTEIMYDTPGSDSGREWVEIHNGGTEALDISGWWFFEGSNHGFQNEEALVIPGGGYAVIVDDPALFAEDFPSAPGLIIDSSAFSLRNSGERIALLNEEKEEVDALFYEPDGAADGEGYALALVDGVFVSAPPTPGRENEKARRDEVVSEEESRASSGSVPALVYKRIRVDAGADRQGIAGADVHFSAEVFGTEGEPVSNPRVIWTFGDGGQAEGVEVTHVYRHPGVYSVFADGAVGKYSASDRFTIRIHPPEIGIGAAVPGEGGYVEIVNGAAREIDLSYFGVRAGGETFYLPAHTYVLPDTTVRVPNATTGLTVGEGIVPTLLFPNGDPVPHTGTEDSRADSGEKETTRPASVALVSAPVSAVSVAQAAPQEDSPRAAPKVSSNADDRAEEEDVVRSSARPRAEAIVLSGGAGAGDGEKEKWFLAFAGVLALSAGSALFLAHGGASGSTQTDPADEYEILED